MRPDPGSDTEEILKVGGLDLTLRRTGQELEIVQSGEMQSGGTLPSLGAFSHICVTVNPLSRVLRVYVNGERAGAALLTTVRNAADFRLGGNARYNSHAEGTTVMRTFVASIEPLSVNG